MPVTENISKERIPLLRYELKSFEKLPVLIWEDNGKACMDIARFIANAILQRQKEGGNLVLGLATGSSPIKIYQELARLHVAEGLSFQNVITFNLDEYFPIQPDAQQSYVRFMHEYLFDHIDIPADNIHIPDGTIPLEEVEAYCRGYENAIALAGGLDIQLLGIGRTGHIGFNEPGAWEDSHTRLVRIDQLTRRDAVREFLLLDRVPYRAITMGIGTIMSARKIFLMAWGSHKADIVREAVEGDITPNIPATYLQKHNDIHVYIDDEAASKLTRISTPWLVGVCNWNEDLICKAVVWLAQKTGKPILKLTDEDYNAHHLSDLLVDYGEAYDININIFNRLQRTITGWPGGKPNADDSSRPERSKPEVKRVIIFSPHPDDDVISMGGTFMRLVDQHHDVHVVYQTSGNIAVHDHDALRFAEFISDYDRENGDKEKIEDILNFIQHKKPNEIDTQEVRRLKGLIRRGEARAGARFAGLEDDHIHFLDMPFYETGRTRKNPLSSADISLVKDIILQIRPHQIFAAGDLADPHDTHRVCLEAITAALHELKNESWMQDCWLWLYRGAWHEWAIDEIQMSVPLSPAQLEKKRRAIFMHQSQKDKAPFPGEDNREFWQRAEDRNKDTAKLYRDLGLAEYEAMESFRRFLFL